MTRCDKITVLAGFSLLLNVSFAAQQLNEPADAQNSNDSVMAVMVTKVTPASDTLWGVGDPQSDKEWQELVVAADDTIAAFELIRNGGSGPNDNQWAFDAKWQDYTDEIVAAANRAKDAADKKNLDALFQANEAIYTPCEACHLDFNPGVAAED